MKIQKSILPKFEISNFGKIGLREIAKSGHKNLKFDFDFEFWEWKFKIYPKKLKFWFQKMRNRDLKTPNSVSILNFRAGNLIFKIPKSFSLISFESEFGTIKFEISDVENPKSLIFVSKFKFFFSQNLDFVLGIC